MVVGSCTSERAAGVLWLSEKSPIVRHRKPNDELLETAWRSAARTVNAVMTATLNC